MKEIKNVRKFIAEDPEIHHGKACFRGTRIPVYIVLELLEAGQSIKDILDGYPRLTKQHIQAAFHYAAEVLKHPEHAAFA